MGVNDDDEDPGLLAAFRKLETGGFSDLAARVKSIPRPLCKAAINPSKAVLSKSSSSPAVSASTTPVRQNGKFAKQGVASFFKRFSIDNIPSQTSIEESAWQATASQRILHALDVAGK